MELLVDTTGNVAGAWMVRPVPFDPPFPDFERGILSEMREWGFEPGLWNGEPAPICLHVTLNIDY